MSCVRKRGRGQKQKPGHQDKEERTVKVFTTAWPRQTTDFFYISQSYWLTLDFGLQIFNSLLLSGMLGWKEFLQQSLSFWTSIVNVSLS